MKDFTQELNKLLDKYPDLGEFTIHVRPRVTIASAMMPVEVPKTTFTTTSSAPIPEVKKEKLDTVLHLEKGISKSRLADLQKSAQVE